MAHEYLISLLITYFPISMKNRVGGTMVEEILTALVIQLKLKIDDRILKMKSSLSSFSH